MTATATSTFTPIPSDFYGMEAKLADREKDVLMRLRAWLESDVKPIVNDHCCLLYTSPSPRDS